MHQNTDVLFFDQVFDTCAAHNMSDFNVKNEIRQRTLAKEDQS